MLIETVPPKEDPKSEQIGGLIGIWIFQILTGIPFFIIYFGKTLILKALIASIAVYYIINALFGGIILHYFIVQYFCNIKDISYLNSFRIIDKFKIFINGISFHYYGKYNNSRSETYREKSTLSVNSYDKSPEIMIENSCGNSLVIVDLNIETEFSESQSQEKFNKIREELRS